MTTIDEKPATDAPAIDMDTLMAFVGKFVGDLGATIGAGNVLLGERLGLYRALAQQPGDARSLAAATDTDPRYVDEWLRGQAAGGYIEYDAASATYSMTPEQAFALTDPTGPVFLPGAFELALGALKAQHHIEESFRTGAGFGWGQHDEDVFTGCERFFRPGYLMHLLHRVDPGPGRRAGQARARRPRRRPRLRPRRLDAADGATRSRPAGSSARTTTPARSRRPRERAEDAGVGDRVRFEVASAQELDGHGLDLVTTFDCLHDMGDPLGAAQHIRRSLAADGTWLIVEPAAGDTVESNLNPVGRVFYSFSTFLCVPNAMSQSGGYALGAQAGEAAIRQVVTDAGFTRFRRVAETPFNNVYEARP